MAAGIDFLGEEIKIYAVKEDANIFERIYVKLSYYYDELKPFKSSVRVIKANYDVSISTFFELLQSIYVFSLFTTLIFSYLIIKHYLLYKDRY